ncbi:DMT family transporter [Meiothermus granaticius]|uniref:Carboxylate/amino acid/amine transporter n=1 Tax=Meiothermus granaticius NBRC 107808 TaxID=1227551 RepID=A0A399FB36_9DEIN|nr:DMT family transporter [Meiothermus granaticius]RIH93824.1 carboxylate/amino acid/amine transporter [Meiothermus granaticius NBRC 107808]GEM86321.1 membrane protein [Meiothermus granaticius NBRC 107808]
MRPAISTLVLVLLGGVLAISFGSILVRLATEAAGTQSPGFSLVMSALRLSLAGLLLLPAWRGLRDARPQPGAWGYALLAGGFLALHFATWITSISLTSIAASVTLVNTNPVWVALISWVWLGQAPKPLTLGGIALAVLGGAVIALGDSSNPGTNPALGNLLAVLGGVAASFYFLLGREAQHRGLGIGLYIAAAYSTAALVLLPVPLLFHTPYTGYPPQTYLWIALMALVPQLLGHSSFNWAVRWVAPVLVTLVILLEPLGASLWAYWLFKELPGPQVLLGAGVLLTGVGLAVLGTRA